MAKFIEVTENNGCVSTINKANIKFVTPLTDDVIACLNMDYEDYNESNTLMYASLDASQGVIPMLLQDFYEDVSEMLL